MASPPILSSGSRSVHALSGTRSRSADRSSHVRLNGETQSSSENVNKGKRLLRIGDACKQYSISHQTIREYMRGGLLPEIRTPGRTRLICRASLECVLGMKGNGEEENERQICIYARVSSQTQQKAGNLDRQIERMMDWVWEVFSLEPADVLVIKDVASAFGTRKGLEKVVDLMMDGKISHLCYEFSDRLSRTSSEKRLLEFLARKHDVKLIPARQTMPEDERTFFVKELVDFIQVVANKAAAKKAADLTRVEMSPEAEKRILELHSQGHTLKKIVTILKREKVRCPKTGKFISYSVLRKNVNQKQMVQRFLDQGSEQQIDWVGRFLKERCATGPNLTVFSKDLYREYLSFARAHKMKTPATRNDLGRNLTRRGFDNFRSTNGKMAWEGLALAKK